MSIQHVLLILLLIFKVHQKDFRIYKHSKSTTARCLDGTQSALYQFQGQQKSKIIIFFEGGGSCNGGLTREKVLEACSKRTQSRMGSSEQYPDSQNFDDASFLSSKEQVNPQFHNWTKFYFPYCDGSFHQGTVSDPVKYNQQELYFRGKDNTQAHLDYLDNQFDIFNSQKLIVMGVSAGAIATMIWGNQIYSRSNQKSGVTLLLDSGIFAATPSDILESQQNPFLKLVNAQTDMPLAQCVIDHPSQYECFNAGIAAEYIIPPTFIVQSPYDIYGLMNIAGVQCPQLGINSCNDQDFQKINDYRLTIEAKIKNFTDNDKNGAWTINCPRHVFIKSKKFQNLVTDEEYISPYKTGLTINDAFKNFLDGSGQRLYIDDMYYRQNPNPNCKIPANIPLIYGLSITFGILLIIGIIVTAVCCYRHHKSKKSMQIGEINKQSLNQTNQKTDQKIKTNQKTR